MTVVGARGQITIEKSIREKLGVKPKDIAVQQLVNDEVIISFLPGPHRRSLRGALKSKPRKPWKSWTELGDVIEQAAAEEFSRRGR